jgi:ribosomal protein L11 methyltransferase
MQSYLELEITFNEENYEKIYNRLYLEGITTILETSSVIKVYLPENDLTLAKKIKNDLLNIDKVPDKNIHLGKFENQDWNKEWEQTIEAVYIKDKIIIYPSWKKNDLKDTNDKIRIEIDPKMSFGTGHNETTQLILEMMCDYIDSNDKFVLDYGCGTGILAIAAIKLGAEKAVAIDIDNDAIENAAEYIKINGVDKQITLYDSDITHISETNFDVITANITSGVIIANLKNIYNKLKPGGKLFITGILDNERDELTQNLDAKNFIIEEVRDKGEWIAYYTVKK